ncbi:probable protein phosphatase 2C 23 [Amborella trichopoda]|uniref:protein-serine/threonine phosphatase n=1 Tax=Amborella trichopoda TaxID=13333 RepID=W1PIL5_AMBTC|nr:probable protein phosphatase 2C 23 [Amborella trichopoda]ERN07838.1 hypothetical protein AMTR_s00012p00193410 [Amborella trichopoda]|eukprot:XP_006846163.1 probable protein phosphatase 2C 23 [Amborella trichopoda]
MGNKFCTCFTGIRPSKPEEPLPSSDEGLGHSFCYIRPEPNGLSSSKVHSEETANNLRPAPTTNNLRPAPTTFRSISGASLSANTSTPLSTAPSWQASRFDRSSVFESSDSFASIPLQLAHPQSFSGALSGNLNGGVCDRKFLSGPIERGFLSGPLDRNFCSGPIEQFQRSLSHSGARHLRRHGSAIKKAIKGALARSKSSIVTPLKSVNSLVMAPKVLKTPSFFLGNLKTPNSMKESDTTISSSVNLSSDLSLEDDHSFESQNLQWAQGKAGEDRVHVVISEEHGWLFVGIYDGFNGPDAPDFLLCNLYSAVHRELKGLLWSESHGCCSFADTVENPDGKQGEFRQAVLENSSYSVFAVEKMREKGHCRSKGERVDESEVLRALEEALKKTEYGYLEMADENVMENPELALMGSCVLVMLMKGEDVFLMNVGDSRGVLARRPINEGSQEEWFLGEKESSLEAVQLTLDHSTCVTEEVDRIRREHKDDSCAVFNGRVKGSLKVTRAFGAGFLKQPKWNDALLEMFRIDYVGENPYITCEPWLFHHRLGPRDQFMILSSDGLYQYFTNEEAVAEVELFIDNSPDGDPAQHLVEEVLCRAAKKAGMELHELLEIPHGDRRRYHDDVSIIVVSLEGRIWRSSV